MVIATKSIDLGSENMNSAGSRSARRALDRRLSDWPSADTLTTPSRGWIRATREALGMSAGDLASRLGARDATVRDIERSESDRRIRLDTLERAANAMGCDLVYALIPRRRLSDIVQQQAETKVSAQVRAVARAMDLEAQTAAPDDEVVRQEIERLIDSGRLWK
jgi:predicted DNA-binding mobile mystery protein A